MQVEQVDAHELEDLRLMAVRFMRQVESARRCQARHHGADAGRRWYRDYAPS